MTGHATGSKLWETWKQSGLVKLIYQPSTVGLVFLCFHQFLWNEKENFMFTCLIYIKLPFILNSVSTYFLCASNLLKGHSARSKTPARFSVMEGNYSLQLIIIWVSCFSRLPA